MTESSSLHILIVDDELPSIEMLQRFFHNTDHLITIAYTSIEALAIIRECPCDLVISDINMPEMDGMQLMREALSIFPFLNFILITGDSCSRSFHELKEAGALTCLAKPFRRSELMEIVDWLSDLKKIGKIIPTEQINSTDRKLTLRMEESRWNSDQRFQAVMNTACDAIVLMDGNGNISYWNPAAEIMFGYRSHEVIGKHLHSLITPQKYGTSAEIGYEEFIRTRHGDATGNIIEITGLRKDQTEFPAELSLSGFKYRGAWHAAGIMRDISSRKQNEDNLRTAYIEIERLYQQLNHEYELANIFFKNVFQNNQNTDNHIKYYLSSMGTAGGDFFLTAPSVSGVKYLLLGDFTGHGLSAALGAIPVSSIFHTMAKKGHPLINIIREINSNLNRILPTGLFFSGCLVEWDHAHLTARVVNFGLPMAIVVSEHGVIKRRLPSRHLPLGILPDIDPNFHYMEVPLQHSDRIYLFTDGITAARNKSGEEFGQERLEQLLTRCQVPEHRFDDICRSITEFRGDTPQLDDMAIAEIICDTSEIDLPTEEITTISNLPVALSLSLTIHPSTMQAAHTLETITELFVEMHIEARKQKQNIFLILSELYSNALEHGILLMNSALKNEPNGFEKYFLTRAERLATLKTGWIKLDMELMVQDTTGRIILRVEDSGQGFDYLLIPTAQPDFSSFGGRGLYLVRSLCKELIIEGIGNKVTAIFEW
jgi:PAS domain S-box-containing protein